MKTLLIVIAILATPRWAAADPLAEAREHYRLGSAHFDKGEYQQAAVEFERAQALAPSAELVFNIAQAHRMGGHCREAVAAYQAYLVAAPQGRRVEHVHGFLAELGNCGAAPPGREAGGAGGKPAARVPAAAPVRPAPGVVRTRPEPPPGPGRTLRLGGLVGAGAGVALLVTGAWLGASASAHEAALESHRGPWGPEQMERERRGRRDSHLAAIASAGGVVAVLAGGTLYLLGRRRPAAPPALVPAGAGAAVVWSGIW